MSAWFLLAVVVCSTLGAWAILEAAEWWKRERADEWPTDQRDPGMGEVEPEVVVVDLAHGIETFVGMAQDRIARMRAQIQANHDREADALRAELEDDEAVGRWLA